MHSDVAVHRQPASIVRQSVTLIFIIVLLAAAAGLRFWPVEPVSAAEGTSVPPFEWSMFSRHTGDYLIDPNDLESAREHVKPGGGYGVTFDGCAALTPEMEAEEWITHTFTVTGSTLPEAVESSATGYRWENPDRFDDGYEPVACEDLTSSVELQQGPYTVTLSIETASGITGTSAPQQILVKDILIISVGDSYGSGEGAPDRVVQYGLFGFPVAPAEWQDRRCHRSAWAGPSQAAALIEESDPHTSVTFVSLACSGATINTPIDDNPDDGATNTAKYQGAGLLTSYSGIEHDGSYDPASFLPPQMEQAARIANGRAIDALTMSGGGNDMHFATVIADCVTSDCNTNETTANRLAADFIKLPQRYNELARFIRNDRNLSIAPALNISPDRVFITEYPDPSRDMQGNWCEANQIDDPLLALPVNGIKKLEMEWASNNVVRPLNQAIEANARKHGWNFVSGIAAEFFDGGHGWCSLGEDQYGAPNNWINRSLQALAMQGPVTLPFGLIAAWAVTGVALILAGSVLMPLAGAGLLLLALASGALVIEAMGTAGTMHPNRMGQMVYARHIAAAMTNRLNGHLPQPGDLTAPTIAPVNDIAVTTLERRSVRIYYGASATTDDFDGHGRAVCSPQSGLNFPIGTTLVTCNAKDSSGNSATPVTFTVTITLALVELTPPGPGSNSMDGFCGDDPGNAFEQSEDAAGVSHNSTALEGSSGAGTFKARATSDGAGERSIHVGYNDIVTVEAGTTGLRQGAPVLVSVTLALDGTFSVTPGDGTAGAQVYASYGVNWIDCDFEANGYDCWYSPVSLGVDGRLSATGGSSMTWDGYGDWGIRHGEGTFASGYGAPSCASECGTSIDLPYNIGSQTVIFESTIGSRFSVSGELRVSAISASGGFAEADFSNTFISSGIQPAPGYEGLTFTYASGSGDGTPGGNEPPTVDAGGPYIVDEGSSVTLIATGNDPDGDALAYAWDLDNDGTYETEGDSPAFSAASLDGPDTRTVAVQVSDGELTMTDQATIEVRNVAPGVTISGAPDTTVEGTPVALTGSVNDPGSSDTFTYGWSATNDGIATASGDGESFSFTPDDAGHHIVILTVTDDDGGTGTATVEFDVEPVSNGAPVVALGDDTSLHRGETYSGVGSFSDPDADTWTASVDYGDGTGIQPLALNPDMTFTLNHTFTTAGAFSIQVCVSDDDGQGCDTLAVSVTAYAIFAGRDDCGTGSGDAIQWSGSKGTLYGDLHSNSGLKVSGSTNTGNGNASYRCQVKVSGSKNTFTSGPVKVTDARPWPVQMDATAFTCDVTVAGKLDLSKGGVWWVNGTKASKQLAPLTLCAGEITLSDSNVTGTVTLVAGRISLSGSNIQLTAHQHGVLFFATGGDQNAIKLSGSNSRLAGDLVARTGGIDLSGSGSQIAGALIGWTVKLSGSNWTIDARLTE